MRRFEELGKRFKEKTDGITVFPKIVSQLKHYYKRWRTNNAIGLVHDSIRLPYQLFLKSLAKLPELTGNLLTFRQSATKELAEELANLEKDNSQQELAIPADMNHPHSVPPALAATQSHYVPTAATRKPWGARKNANVCYYYPYCKSLECGGCKDGMQMCTFVRSGSIVIPDTNQFVLEKTRCKRQLVAHRRRASRKMHKGHNSTYHIHKLSLACTIKSSQ
jgi:hypothetical protein